VELKYPAVEWQFLITRGTRLLSKTFIASINSGDSLTIRFKRPAVTQKAISVIQVFPQAVDLYSQSASLKANRPLPQAVLTDIASSSRPNDLVI